VDLEKVAKEIVDAAIKVHKALGPGLLESTYQHCLAYELTSRGLKVECEVPVPIVYRDRLLEVGYRADMIIENSIVIENKCVEAILPIHEAQLLAYLRLRESLLGFLLNWNVLLMKDGIRRFINRSGTPQGKKENG
jgi:GxxExxY protein